MDRFPLNPDTRVLVRIVLPVLYLYRAQLTSHFVHRNQIDIMLSRLPLPLSRLGFKRMRFRGSFSVHTYLEPEREHRFFFRHRRHEAGHVRSFQVFFQLQLHATRLRQCQCRISTDCSAIRFSGSSSDACPQTVGSAQHIHLYQL